MIRVGITGQPGFIGSHLYNTLSLQDSIQCIPFEDAFFSDSNKLDAFVSSCDAIVHLAAMNRHGDQQVIYNTNISLVKQLIESFERTGISPYVLFSSSVQEEKDNLYGKSKQEGRMLLEEWATKNNAQFTGLIIPNVFGPFGNPFYNSVVATFSHQLTHGETPKIEIDAEMPLIYVGSLCNVISDLIAEKRKREKVLKIAPEIKIQVTQILEKLIYFKKEYFENHCFPLLNDRFDIQLFNTFRSYIDCNSRFPVLLKKNTDQRGCFVETVKTAVGGQFSFSTTLPEITRGNHFHTRKIERFIVIKGEAEIELRRIGTKEIMKFKLNGDNPSFVDMPVWYTHNIRNTGTDELLTLFWINEAYDPTDPDTYFETV